MKSKVLSLILAVCTLCSLLVSPASAVGGDSAVQMVQALGILDGTDLESPVTRAEFSKMLVAASSYKDSVSSEGSGYSLFRDVKSSYWGLGVYPLRRVRGLDDRLYRRDLPAG